MAKEPAAAERRDTEAHFGGSRAGWSPALGWGEARVPARPRHWHTSSPCSSLSPKASTVVSRLQTVGVGFRCLHHHSRFPVRLEVISKRVSKRGCHMLISLSFILVAHLRLLVEISTLFLLSQAKVRINQVTPSTGLRRLQCCYLPVRATEEEIRTFTNSAPKNFLLFPNNLQLQSISTAKSRKRKKPYSKLQPLPSTQVLGFLQGGW